MKKPYDGNFGVQWVNGSTLLRQKVLSIRLVRLSHTDIRVLVRTNLKYVSWYKISQSPFFIFFFHHVSCHFLKQTLPYFKPRIWVSWVHFTYPVKTRVRTSDVILKDGSISEDGFHQQLFLEAATRVFYKKRCS